MPTKEVSPVSPSDNKDRGDIKDNNDMGGENTCNYAPMRNGALFDREVLWILEEFLATLLRHFDFLAEKTSL